MGEKNSVAYCRRCERDTPHKRGRKCRWHCLICGNENVRFRSTARAKGSLPPGFLLEKNAVGELYLYMEVPVVREGREEKEVLHYLKSTFPSDTARGEIESRAWEVYMTLKNETEHD